MSLQFHLQRAKLESLALQLDINDEAISETAKQAVDKTLEAYADRASSAPPFNGGNGGWLFDVLLQPLLNVALQLCNAGSPFLVIKAVILELEKFKGTQPVVVAAARTLDALLALLSANSYVSPEAFSSALKATVGILGPRLKPAAFITCAEVCLKALKSPSAPLRAAAMQALAATLKAAATHSSKQTTQLDMTLGDLIGVIAAVISRHSKHDASLEVRRAAVDASQVFEPPTVSPQQQQHKDADSMRQQEEDDEATSSSCSPPNQASVSVHEDSCDSVSFMSRTFELPVQLSHDAETLAAAREAPPTQAEQHSFNLGDGSNALNSPLVALASTPLPNFESPVKEEFSSWSGFGASGRPRREQSDDNRDVFSLDSQAASSLAASVDAEVVNFLRGSILPFGNDVEQQLCSPDEYASADAVPAGDAPSDIFGSLNTMEHSNTKSDEYSSGVLIEKSLPIGLRHVALLHAALQTHFGDISNAAANVASVALSTADIETILQTALDIQSEQLYNDKVRQAELVLEEQAEGIAPPDEEILTKQARALEAEVHMSVALELEKFMDNTLPGLADVLANPKLLQQCCKRL